MARISFVTIAVILCATAALARADEPFSLTSQPTTEPTTTPAPEAPSLFRDPKDGDFDISGFLSTRSGFLPLVIPITEPAVGYGLAVGLTFFHGHPQIVPTSEPGQTRVLMPSMTVVFGAATENGTYAGGLAHLGVWDDGRVRYVGAAGYASANLDWYGTGNALDGHSISYTNKVLFLQQQMTFQLGQSDFFIGPVYRFLSTDASFTNSSFNSGILPNEFQSQTSGLGLILDYDTRDQPFSPTKGQRAELKYTQQATWLGGDFDYWKMEGYYITYFPLRQNLVLGVHLDAQMAQGEQVPFYDLPFINMRGIPIGRYTDNTVVQAEVELRYDLTQRWSIVGFGGVGRVASTFGDLGSAPNEPAFGAGFRYLIARQYGLRLGIDVAHSNDDCALYITMGTGWVRP